MADRLAALRTRLNRHKTLRVRVFSAAVGFGVRAKQTHRSYDP